MDALDAYLHQQSTEGDKDSEGSFTVAGEHALRKLSSHQLPRTSAWLLKMIQAGVSAGSQRITVAQSARTCTVKYIGGQFGSLEDIRRIWIDVSPLCSVSQAHLMVGLRAVAFARRRPILVAQNCPQAGLRTMRWNGRELSKISEGRLLALVNQGIGWPKVGELIFIVSGSPLGEDASLRTQKGVRETVVAEFRELQKYAVCCPVPLSIDGRPVNHFGLEDVSMTKRSLAFSAQAAEVGQPEGREPMTIPASLAKDRSLCTQARLAWTLWYSNKPSASVVSWVHSGVVAQEELLNVPQNSFSVRLFLPADGLETDLTALHLRFPDESDRQAWIEQALRQFGEEIAHGSQISESIIKASTQTTTHFGLSAFLILGGIILAPATGGWSALGGIGAAAGLVNSSKHHILARSEHELEFFRRSLTSRRPGL